MRTTTVDANNETADSAMDDGMDLTDSDELDAELALLAHAAEDLGAATETLDVATLTDTEKRLLIAMMRERLHLPSPQHQHEHDQNRFMPTVPLNPTGTERRGERAAANHA